MKISLALLCLLLCSACEQKPFAVQEVTFTTSVDNPQIQFQTIRIDGCQYLMTPVHMGFCLTHKGNCDNQIHPKQVENPR